MAWTDKSLDPYRRAMDVLLKTYDNVNRNYQGAYARDESAARTVLALYAMKMDALAIELANELNKVQRQSEMDVDEEPVWIPPPDGGDNLCVHLREYEEAGVAYVVDVGDDQFRQEKGAIPACTLYSIETARILIDHYRRTPDDVSKFKTAICQPAAWKNLVARSTAAYMAWRNHYGKRMNVTTPTSLEIKDDRVRSLFGDSTRVLEGIGNDYNILSSLINYESILKLINWMCNRIQSRPCGLIFTYGGSSSAIIYLPFSGKANGRIVVFDSHGKVRVQRMACAVFDISLIRMPNQYVANEKAIAQVARFVHRRIAFGSSYYENTQYVREFSPEETTFSSFIVEW